MEFGEMVMKLYTNVEDGMITYSLESTIATPPIGLR